MTLPASGWSNVDGTAKESCPCGTWTDHWVKHSGKSWPASCSVNGCAEAPTLGAHVSHPDSSEPWIVPMCDSCNGIDGTFTLVGDLVLVEAKPMQRCGQ